MLILNRKLSLVSAFLILGAIGCADPGVETAEPIAAAVLIENVTAIDAINGVRSGIDVSVRDGKILSVGAHGASKVIAETRIDGTGKFLLPGLWDAHVHLTYAPGINHRTFFPLSIAHGITSLRDTGGHLNLIEPAIAAAKADDLSPDLYFSGPLIDGEQRVYDGSTPGSPDLSVGVGTPEAAEAMVDELVDAGADFVKAYEMLSPDAFRAVAAQAQKRGVPVAAHTPLSMSVMESIDAGANDMQHLRNIEFDCSKDAAALHQKRQEMLAASDAETAGKLRSAIHKAARTAALAQQDETACNTVIAKLASEKVFQTPTLVVSRFLSRQLFADEAYRKSFDLMPPEIAEGWRTRSNRIVGFEPDQLTLDFDEWIMSMIPRLRDAGVPIMAGTDAPIGYLTPGASLHEELAELVDAGLTPMEAITAATYTPAQFLGLEEKLGTISVGMNADLVLLDKDPLLNIRDIAAIQTVVKKGNVIDRNALDELLAAPAALRD